MTPDPILHAFDLLSRRTPDAPLVVSPERRATVGGVDALARAAGRLLADAALAPGAVVGLAAANGPGFLASLLAVRRAGLAALLLDAQTPDAEALRIVRALGAAALLRCRTGWPGGPGDWEWTGVECGLLHLPGATVVKLTSGSTGLPRGIATTAEALLADDAALTASMGLRADDRLLTTIPLSHSYGLSSLALPALARGILLVLPEEKSVYDPFATAERTGATFFPAVPAHLDALVRMAEPPPLPASLRLVITAGAPLSPTTSERFRELFGIPVHVFYGASECGGICYDRPGGAAERGTVGAPVEGVQVGLEGEGIVTVESAAVASGYVPEGDPRLAGGRFQASDLGTWKHGELALRGRVDDLVNIKGKKVNPREIESVIGRLAGVDEVAVLGVSIPGRPGEVLRAVVACPPGSLTAEDVIAWCRSHLSGHKVPRSVLLVPELPRTSRGKLDRLALQGSPGRG
jgi:acyl-CoA synthetase (AMP-forming)/AMP-acid ligase II